MRTLRFSRKSLVTVKNLGSTCIHIKNTETIISLLKILLAASLCCHFLSAQEFSAGKETTVSWPDTANKHLKVYLPENYSPEKKWPAIFYFHGLNGKPGTGILQKYTYKKDFIIVSMDYYVKGIQRFKSFQESLDYTVKEYDNVIAARDTLSKSITIDPKQILLAGISKGGWITANICETKLNDFAGAIIFLAGKQGGPKRPLKTPLKSGIPMYVGVGEQDGNFIPGVAAIKHFQKIRAQVTFETFDGVGHSMPEEAPIQFTEWLNIHRPDFKQNIDTWLKTKL
ncbi:MAG: dienelactone hydrolase family protein, partial [Lentisphaeraceae bacterium]|nr:dienelactone hydrolase family protein [Lentisphaeraceae bacterium]